MKTRKRHSPAPSTNRYRRRSLRSLSTALQQLAALGRSRGRPVIAALVDPHKQQVSLGRAQPFELRGASFRALVLAGDRLEYQRRRNEYVDRGRNTILDSNGMPDLLKLMSAAWNNGCPSNARPLVALYEQRRARTAPLVARIP